MLLNIQTKNIKKQRQKIHGRSQPIQITTKDLRQIVLPSSTGHTGGTVEKMSQVHSSGNQPCFLEFLHW